MVWRHFCDECGSENEVGRLAISAEVSRGGVLVPEELIEEGKEAGADLLAYERDLCSSCRKIRITEYLYFLEKLKKRR